MFSKLSSLDHQDIVLSVQKGFDRFRCEPVQIGLKTENDSQSYHYNNLHREHFLLFQYTISGCGRFTDHQHHMDAELTAGTAFLLHSPSDTRYWLPEGKHWEFIYLLYVGGMAEYLTLKLIEHHGPVLQMSASSEPVQTLISLYCEALAGIDYNKFHLSSRLYRFLMTLHSSANRDKPEIPEALEEVLRFIEQNYSNMQIGIDEMAEVAGLSRYYFTRNFTKHLGSPPYAWLLQVRIRKAVDLLISTSIPIKQIGDMVGIPNPAYFCNVFKKHIGVSPGTFRRHKLD